jgi:hypothetical protein
MPDDQRLKSGIQKMLKKLKIINSFKIIWKIAINYGKVKITV